MTETQPNRNHKDSVFTMLFSDPPAALEIYNAVTGQNYPPDTKIEIVTLSNAIFKGQLNDVAFVVDDRLIVLMEHQSTINKNRQTMELAEAIESAIKSCVKQNILVYFLEKHASEVLNMLFTEWNDDAIAVAREEAHEDGSEEKSNEH